MTGRSREQFRRSSRTNRNRPAIAAEWVHESALASRVSTSTDWPGFRSFFSMNRRNAGACSTMRVTVSGVSIGHVNRLSYQKRLRLVEARRLMVDDDETEERSSFRVGYRSTSQFSREYVRMFGVSPRRDAPRMRRVGNGLRQRR
jgi:AraC-like DNA-binding protein